MINEYIGIANYYDNLLTSGYFNYDSLSNILYNLLGARRKVLDIGVGTGLLTEKMLYLANYNIVGVDFSPRMLEIAKNRLANLNVRLICQDITEFETEEKFEAIVSTGGVICILEEDGEYRISSHIIDPEKNQQLLAKLHSQLDEGGLLALGIQGGHTSYKKEIKDEIFYEQKIKKEGNYLDKWYVFSQANGEILSEQFCRFYFFDGGKTTQALIDAGFNQGYQIIDSKFLVSYK
ncbi:MULTISPECIES: bifunctional 2-polyprenyl-6-hydroxyphenol methylase/3-demethylubiquinol 3-O-methyltransferase UbiG [Okeania]|uniref:Class I SAM-dependent methyltransferase n=1 Tax=Okeania hirsuta TaxID=1458930 RepID=A0A3N6PDC9_9CYAN|nr:MULTISPECIES: class I SAM-dependent methyltransferase [Okeania]NET12008.1 class I SAM-dependent methyltransferase [Okeania sp. SIO1H6]NES78327.1 class I SAM-dependent methyltransferase [Okeania sp. SIO1H4]NES88466.1 class I SAM-dependent methyltransferase [Okeania sp. SIO2B9]NET21666.1 class I SAM-dependent methyltransferase [Okeania sp. SIO1H5]NET79962.1 class I SAM-dependent methyltransferase [Okeania sp. SIO1F9]